MQNTFVKLFNGRLRDECLNEHVIGTFVEASRTIESWRIDDNTVQLHVSLAGLTSVDLAAKTGALSTRRTGGTAPREGSMPQA